MNGDLYDAIESVLASDHSCPCDMEHLRVLWLRDRAALAAPAPSEPYPADGDDLLVLSDEYAPLAASASSEPGLDAAWAEATDALAPTQRLVMWQDRNGPRYLQVLAADEEEDMQPVISVLADYPSKGLGKGAAVELRALAARLRKEQE